MTAYRSRAERPALTRVTLCEACGAARDLREDEADFVCRACRFDQIVGVASDAAPSMRGTGQRFAAYKQLIPLAESLGLRAEPCIGVRVVVAGVTCEVGIELNSGTPCGVELTAQMRGFPPMVLTRETPDEQRAKRRGLTREVQTGDAAFDAAVFIDSRARDEDVLTVLGSPAVRAAVVRLLRDFTHVRIDESGVAARLPRDTKGCYRAALLRRALGALRVVVGAPRPLHHAIVPRRPASRGLSIYAGCWLPVGVPALIASGLLFTPLHPAGPLLAALVGVVLGAAALLPIRSALRGRSDSHQVFIWVAGGTLLTTGACACALAMGLNGALDASPERVSTGLVTQVSYDDEDHTSTATVIDPDLGEVSMTFADAARLAHAGQRMTYRTRRGALGIPWVSQHATLQTDTLALDGH